MIKEFLDRIDVDDIVGVSGMDATFLYGESPTSPMHIGSVAIIEGDLKFDTFKKIIASRLHMLPKLRKRLMDVPLGVDYPYWVDDPNFDISLHLQHVALPAPGGWAELRALASSIFSEPLDKTRPLWSYTFVEGLDTVSQVPKGSVAVIAKVHHVAIDGMAGAGMMAVLFDLAPSDKEPPAPKPFKPEPLPNELKLIYKSAISFAKNPLKLPKIVTETITSTIKAGVLTRVKRMDMPTAPFTAPATPFNGIISASRKWNTTILEFDRVRQLKSIMGCTLNDVILSICAGALHKYLVGKDKLPLKPLVAMVPISNRAKSDKSTEGNKLSAMLVQLASNIEDPIERLEAIQANAIRGKTYNNALGAKSLSNLAEAVPFGIANQAAKMYSRYHMAKAHNPVFNLVITNVPGPQVPLYINKHKLVSVMGTAPIIDGMGLMVVIFSYNGQLTISSTSDARSMPDIDEFNRYVLESANELEEHILKYKAAADKKKKKGKPASDKFFENIKKFIKKDPTAIKADSGVFQFNITGPTPATWGIDLNKQPGVLRRGDAKDPDVTLTIREKHLLNLGSGDLDIQTAFVQGRVEIDGDQKKAIRLVKILSLLPKM